MRMLAWATALAVTGVAGGGASAQQAHGRGAATLTGTVADEVSGAGLAGAMVSLVGRRVEVVTDGNGSFEIVGLEPGPVTIRVQRSGYSTLVEAVEVAPGLDFVQLRLVPVTAVLEALQIRTGHRGAGGANVLNARDEAPGARTAADLVAGRIPGLFMAAGSGSAGAGSRVVIRGPKSIALDSEPAIYVDGIRVGAPEGATAHAFRILSEIPATEVRRIRVIRGAAAGPEYGDSANGVILVETTGLAARPE